MQLASPEPPGLTLECRTWACRIRVLHGARLKGATWEKTLSSAPLAGRIHSIAVVGRRPTTDALDGEDLVEATVYFKLVDPSGEPVAAVSTSMAFVAEPECPKQLAGVEQRLAAMKRIIERDASPAERFARERAQPASYPRHAGPVAPGDCGVAREVCRTCCRLPGGHLPGAAARRCEAGAS